MFVFIIYHLSNIYTAIDIHAYTKVTLHKNWAFEDMIPAPKIPRKLPVLLSQEEVFQFLSCIERSIERFAPSARQKDYASQNL
jgi:hypothetical protein